MIGLSVLELTCLNLNVFHILAWYLGVVVISSAAGVLLAIAVEYSERRRNKKAAINRHL